VIGVTGLVPANAFIYVDVELLHLEKDQGTAGSSTSEEDDEEVE
jgi:hypothetical protein